MTQLEFDFQPHMMTEWAFRNRSTDLPIGCRVLIKNATEGRRNILYRYVGDGKFEFLMEEDDDLS